MAMRHRIASKSLQKLRVLLLAMVTQAECGHVRLSRGIAGGMSSQRVALLKCCKVLKPERTSQKEVPVLSCRTFYSMGWCLVHLYRNFLLMYSAHGLLQAVGASAAATAVLYFSRPL